MVFAGLAAGCASGGSSVAYNALIDPAQYSLYDCKQLTQAYGEAIAKEREVLGRMERARTGTAGAMMAEIGYGPDYAMSRGHVQGIEEAARKINCALAVPEPRTPRY